MKEEDRIRLVMVFIGAVVWVFLGRVIGGTVGLIVLSVAFVVIPAGKLRIGSMFVLAFVGAVVGYFFGPGMAETIKELKFLFQGYLTFGQWALSERFVFGNIGWGVCGFGLLLGLLAEQRDAPAKLALREAKSKVRNSTRPVSAPSRSMSRINKLDAAVSNGTLVGAITSSGASSELSDADLNTHALVAGTTGGGKTVFVSNIVESFIQRGLPVIYIDGKGDTKLARQVQRFAEEHDRPCWGFSMHGESCLYNPLSSGGFSSKKDRIIELREWSEAHYRKLAEGYLQTVFKILAETGVAVDLVSVTDHLAISNLRLVLREAVKSGQLTEDRAKQLTEELSDQADVEKDIVGLRAELRNLARSELGTLFDTSKGSGEAIEGPQRPVLRLSEVIRRRGVAYMSLSPLEFPLLADTIGKLIVNDLKSSLDPTNPQKLLLVIDEFTTLAGPQVLNILNQGRSMGVHAVLTVQSLADLGQKIEGNAALFVEQVLSNCNVYAVHRMNNPSDASTLAETIGTKRALEITSQLGDAGATGMGSVRQVREFHGHPDEIKSLRTGEAFLANKNTGRIDRISVRFSKLVR